MAYSIRSRLATIGLAVVAGIGVKLTFNAPVAAAVTAALVFTSGFLRGDVRPDPRRESMRRARSDSALASGFADPPGF